MKTKKFHILFSWILLIIFTAGQYSLYAHQHPNSSRSEGIRLQVPVKTSPHNSYKQKCSLCDVMHHNNMEAASGFCPAPVSLADYFFKQSSYSFTSLNLILAAGRAPPATLRA